MKTVNTALDALPTSLMDRSGSVFYSGPQAFEQASDIYILGLNPGGDPVAQQGNTVGKSISEWRERAEPYSSYVDEIWEGNTPGAHGMQPKIQHMAKTLNIDLQLTPASNVVFARTRDEASLSEETQTLLAQCWPVHQAVIQSLGIRMLICLGGTAGSWVSHQVGAQQEIARYTETNKRGWNSTVSQAPDGLMVASLSHPGRADWRNPLADPSPMLSELLAR